MRISADIASLISTERMVVIEHEFDGEVRKVTFPLSLYKKNHFAEDNETFQVINEYWASLSHHKQGEIYHIYEDVRELFDSVTGNTELKAELTTLVSKLMGYHKTADVRKWILYGSDLKVPSDVKREYIYDVDKNTTEDKTYIYDDYVGLMSLSVIFRSMIPIWAMYNKPAKDAIGKIWKEMSSFMLLQESEVYRSEPMERLIRYIKANINKDTYTGNHTLEFICSSDMPIYLLSLVCVRKLMLGELYSNEPRQNLAALVYTYIIERPSPHGGDHSQQVRTKKLRKEGAGEGNENSGSTLELYKARAAITVGRTAEMQYSLRDPVSLAIELCPDADPEEVTRDCEYALISSQDMLERGIQIPQVILTQWVINPVFPAQGILHMSEDVIIRMCAVTETVLRHRGFGHLALLATAVAVQDDSLMRVSTAGSKAQITDELAKALEVNYPFERVPKRKTATNTSYNFVQEDIKKLALEFGRYTWRATAHEKLVVDVLKTHVRRVSIPTQLRIDIGNMLVNAEEQFN